MTSIMLLDHIGLIITRIYTFFRIFLKTRIFLCLLTYQMQLFTQFLTIFNNNIIVIFKKSILLMGNYDT